MPFAAWEQPVKSAAWCWSAPGCARPTSTRSPTPNPSLARPADAMGLDDPWDGLRQTYAREAPRFLADALPGLAAEQVRFVPHHVAHAASAALAGPHRDSPVLLLPRPAAASPAPGAVPVHPGAASAARRWPAGRYTDVVRGLLLRGHRVVVTGGPGEEELVGAVAVAGAGPLTGGLPFGVLSALVAGASAVVSGDTGLAHLAVAHGTPSVTLFGPVAPALWGPPPSPRHAALWHPGPPGDPHGDVPDPLLLRVGVPEVLAAVREVIGAAGVHTAGRPGARPGPERVKVGRTERPADPNPHGPAHRGNGASP
ncbi:glycosyltransferase family 9 protein [Streptomyces sp. L500]